MTIMLHAIDEICHTYTLIKIKTQPDARTNYMKLFEFENSVKQPRTRAVIQVI